MRNLIPLTEYIAPTPVEKTLRHRGNDAGVVCGTVQRCEQGVRSWLHHCGSSQLFEDTVRGGYPVAFLDRVEIAPAFRHKGLGSKALATFETSARRLGAKTLVLISDDFERQADGFSLREWYQKHGFVDLHRDSYTTFFIKSL